VRGVDREALRPVYHDNMLRHYEALAHEDPEDSHVVDLDGTPALIGRDVELVAGGTDITVMGTADEADYVPPAAPIALSDLSATLGAPVVLPDTSDLKPTGDARAWSGGTCPHPTGTGYWVGSRPTACWQLQATAQSIVDGSSGQ
jgi:hypothetical protein